MAIQQTKLLPALGVLGILIIGTILYQQFKGTPTPVKEAAPMATVPKPAPLPKAKGADGDNANETLNKVVASNRELSIKVDEVVQRNARLEEENRRLRNTPNPAQTAPTGTATAPASGDNGRTSTGSGIGSTVDSAARAVDIFLQGGNPNSTSSPGVAVAPNGAAGAAGSAGNAGSSGTYKTVAPMGYASFEDKDRSGSRGPPQTRYVRTLGSASATAGQGNSSVPAAPDGASRANAVDEPYFTLPENSTLVGVQAMTSIIGRVPIDGRVTDPMQFKAVVGRDNLAANGWELPDDIVGMIVTGVAIGDMALSCSEGKIRSLTFVFNDGTIRTVSARTRSGPAGGGSGGGGGGDLGFISDPYGNPCIVGKFVTNAPRFLSDMIAVNSLGLAAKAYSQAQQQTTTNSMGANSTTVLNTDKYVLGQAVAGATDEVSQWMLQRLKNSFDAVVTPSGQRLVVHLDQEVRLDKAPEARKIIHRLQSKSGSSRGANYGLE